MTSNFTSLIDSSRNGDENAVNELFHRYYELVRRCVHNGLSGELRPSRPWLGALFSTGDIVQEVFLSVLHDLDSFSGESESQFIGYLSTVTKSRLVDAIRFHEAMRRDRRRVKSGLEPDDTPEEFANPLRAAITAEEVARFVSALNHFSERERLLLRGRLESKTKFEDLATSLGYPSPDAARKAYYTAQARLATRIADAEERQRRS